MACVMLGHTTGLTLDCCFVEGSPYSSMYVNNTSHPGLPPGAPFPCPSAPPMPPVSWQSTHVTACPQPHLNCLAASPQPSSPAAFPVRWCLELVPVISTLKLPKNWAFLFLAITKQGRADQRRAYFSIPETRFNPASLPTHAFH